MADPLLPLVDGIAPPLPLLLRWCERIRARAVADARRPLVAIPHLPDGNGVLPDALRLGGIETVRLPERDDLPYDGFRWEGLGGARVRVVGDDLDDDPAGLPLHVGNLPAPVPPADQHDPAALYALLDLARLEDATALLADEPPADESATWDHLLASAGLTSGDFDRPLPMPPGRTTRGDPRHPSLWNPLPFARRALTVLPAGDQRPPWALRAADGRQAPVQVVDLPDGSRELLVSFQLDALQGLALTGESEPVAEPNWEVSATVLDNGVVRAEFDALGHVSRLCWDGRFADLIGPAVAPRRDGLPLTGETTVTVAEAGPVRGLVVVERRCLGGTLSVRYELHAHEDVLRVQAAWTASGDQAHSEPPVLVHPTGHRAGDLWCSGDGGRWSIPAKASLFSSCDPVRGIRWASLGDSGGRSLAVVGARPLAVRAESGHLEVAVEGNVQYAIAGPRGDGRLNLGQLAQHLACPARASTAGERTAPWRFTDLGGVVPLWARRIKDWRGAVLLAEQAGSRGRATWFIACREAARVMPDGAIIAALPATPEGDGWQVDFAPGELAIIAWR
ncbi:hypothetical protein LBMAG53_19710 [Planctomycetota bacterium]|nr:hypothetical protein LBMAG53_19710 [Planctomycetota bacterium]